MVADDNVPNALMDFIRGVNAAQHLARAGPVKPGTVRPDADPRLLERSEFPLGHAAPFRAPGSLPPGATAHSDLTAAGDVDGLPALAHKSVGGT